MGLRERLVASAAEIRTRSQRLVELNVELLTAELKRKGQQYGAAVGLFVVAGVLALYALGFALTTITVALALVLPLWLALLIVTAVLVLIVLILALVGRGRLRRAKTPAPERAIAEAKATVGTVKTGLQQTANDLAPRRKVQPPRDVVSTATAHLATPPPTPPAPPTPTPPTTPTATPPTMPPGAPAPTPRDMPPSDDEVR
jgi:hypothetical protein